MNVYVAISPYPCRNLGVIPANTLKIAKNHGFGQPGNTPEFRIQEPSGIFF